MHRIKCFEILFHSVFYYRRIKIGRKVAMGAIKGFLVILITLQCTASIHCKSAFYKSEANNTYLIESEHKVSTGLVNFQIHFKMSKRIASFHSMVGLKPGLHVPETI